ncbi:efflux RND transporter periplasmic adaptor subunit [Geobacter pelophilus]|uniref:Efflux RND transporter periplasmic adaptor subunit n=1 Tax=Geoanaerobacter pelophilus TaxID=60036 RepID=A0AAW4L5C0_9BACT|nr:efflux RND transporter periplasmic adaptor subunit [Geoanaerobacter pelophilus]MBT0665357.1 efflux RND transporter periplasmic adaptor subunit [Geoanaerobacter pelophilus]
MNRYVIPVVVALSLATLTACSGNGEARKEGVQKPPVAVEAGTIAPTTLVEGIEVTGSLEPKFYADVKTQIPGLVKQVFVTEWVRVRKGQPLARIDVAETEAMVKRSEANVESAKAGLAQAQVAVSRADRELARIRKLKESGLATQQAVDDATTESDAAKARIDAAKAQIRAAEEEVRQGRARQGKGLVVSPLDGVVALREVNVGDLASDAAAGKPIFRIVDNRLLNLTVTLPSSESARAKVGQPLEFTVDSLPGKLFTGTVMYVNPELNSSDRSLKVIAEVINNNDILKGGLFAKGKIIAGKRNNVIQVPRQALATWDTTAKKGTMFVVEGDSARLRQVVTGIVTGDLVEVVTGVKTGDRYVSRGAFNLKDGDKVALAGTGKQQ